MAFLNLGTPDAMMMAPGTPIREFPDPDKSVEDHRRKCASSPYQPVCAAGQTYNNKYCAWAAGVRVMNTGKCEDEDTQVVCGNNGKWYKNVAAASAAGVGIDLSHKACADKDPDKPRPGGPGGADLVPEAQIPAFYNYLQGLPGEIDVLYQELQTQNLIDIAMMRGLYDQIAPDILGSYKQSLETNRQRLTQLNQQMTAFSSLMGQAPEVIESFLSGEVVDPIVADAINRAVGLTASQATLAGAPIQGSTYLTQAATRAATEAAAPIRLGAQRTGMEMMGQFGGMTQLFGQMTEREQLLPFGPQFAGMSAGGMMQGLQQNLLAQQAWPMQQRLGMLGGASNLMGSAINQILAPWNLGIGLGNMWSPYGWEEGGKQRRVTRPLPVT